MDFRKSHSWVRAWIIGAEWPSCVFSATILVRTQEGYLKKGTLVAWIFRAQDTLGWIHRAQYWSKSDSKGTQEFFQAKPDREIIVQRSKGLLYSKPPWQQEAAKAGATHVFSTLLFQANFLCSLLGLSIVELRSMFEVGKWKILITFRWISSSFWCYTLFNT